MFDFRECFILFLFAANSPHYVMGGGGGGARPGPWFL